MPGRARERERERHFGSSIAPLLGGLCRLLARGGAGGLTWTVTPGEPSQFSQRCLSLIPDAAVLKRPTWD